MKVRINPDGSMEFDVDNVADAVALVGMATPRRKTSRRRRAPRADKATELNEIQLKTWSYLVDNDTETGVHLSDIARHLGIKKDNACWWCQTLLKAGYAQRVSRGYYRALV